MPKRYGASLADFSVRPACLFRNLMSVVSMLSSTPGLGTGACSRISLSITSLIKLMLRAM